MSRARDIRADRRARTFASFKPTQLNLIPLVDTFVSIVFFSLTTASVAELAPVVPGVRLPEATLPSPALAQLTLGIGAQVSLAGRPLVATVDAARAVSDDPRDPLVIPAVRDALAAFRDSVRAAAPRGVPVGGSLPLAIQADRTIRYDLLSRFLQSARVAGFRNISLQVRRPDAVPSP